MGKLKPSILTGMFSHLSMNHKKKDKTEYENLRQISPKSRVKQKRIDSYVPSLLNKIKPKNQKNKALLTPAKKTPEKLMKSKKAALKAGVLQVLDNVKNPFRSSVQYDEMMESPNKTPSNPVKREKFKNSKLSSLRERMLKRLKAARFRYMNEQLYTLESKGAQQMFSEDPQSFKAYHDGYKQQLALWPTNPLDNIIKSLKKSAKSGALVVADFGCGEARLAQALPCTVHSLDLVALNPHVTACDMAHTPLPNGSVDVAVFCLSLMGTNILDYIREANRVLKESGIMKIAEIESRFEDLNSFIHGVERMGFEAVAQDLSHNLFYFLDFKKTSNGLISVGTAFPYLPRVLERTVCANLIPKVSQFECERGFSAMNLIMSPLRSSLYISTVCDLLRIRLHGPPVTRYNPEPHIKSWLAENVQ